MISGKNETFGTVLCSEYIERLDLGDAEREALSNELIYPNHLYCPDFTSFEVRGQQDLQNKYLYFWAKAHDDYVKSDQFKQATVYQGTITRYFDPELYLENGFLGFVNLD